jgi:hypothetical protein
MKLDRVSKSRFGLPMVLQAAYLATDDAFSITITKKPGT